MDHLQLLLAQAQTGRPVLEHGLPGEALEYAPRLATRPRSVDAFIRDALVGDPNDLARQRWGVVAPEGKVGDLMLDAIAPLIRHREQEQGARARIYRVAPGMSARDAVHWRNEVYRAEDVRETERPRYLMVLGDLHHVSLELQQVMAESSFVGRVHVGDAGGEPDADGYAAYAAKAVTYAQAAERVEQAHTPRILLYVANDGTMATMMGRLQLVEPCRAALAKRAETSAAMRDIALVTSFDPRYGSSPGALLRAAETPRPAILLSVTHGQGAPTGGWSSAARQRAEQGALVLGDGTILDAETLRGRRFLPGGMWFCVACFGAGTPQQSVFHAWLASLVNRGVPRGILAPALASLPGPDAPRPFISAMPQAALANPHGPLAMISHVELAWTYSFGDPRRMSRGIHSRVLSVLDVWLRRARAGVALDTLMRFYREANDSLMEGYQAQANAQVDGLPDPTDPMERGQLWMLRNDLRGYVLLGDPAARLSGPTYSATAEAAGSPDGEPTEWLRKPNAQPVEDRSRVESHASTFCLNAWFPEYMEERICLIVNVPARMCVNLGPPRDVAAASDVIAEDLLQALCDLSHLDVLVLCPGASIAPLSLRLPMPPESQRILEFTITPHRAGKIEIQIVLLVHNEPIHRTLFPIEAQPADNALGAALSDLT